MLPRGTRVVGWYRGVLNSGAVVDECGSAEHPETIVIGDFKVPNNVSTALATSADGESRTVKAPYVRAGAKPGIATYEVHFVRAVKVDAIEEETLHGAECACGCHKLREALM